jgi:hypothetical protein
MAKSTSPAANAGLPAIDRRSLLCGLGAAAVAGVPTSSDAKLLPHDPVFQAMVAHEHAEKIYAKESNEALRDSAFADVWDAEYEVMETKPSTPAGAVALLRFVASLMEGFFPDDDEHEHYALAIRNAADFFEGNASA